jgi:hypothetical protein
MLCLSLRWAVGVGDIGEREKWTCLGFNWSLPIIHKVLNLDYVVTHLIDLFLTWCLPILHYEWTNRWMAVGCSDSDCLIVSIFRITKCLAMRMTTTMRKAWYPNSKSIRCASALVTVDPGTSPVEFLSSALAHQIAGLFLCDFLHRDVGRFLWVLVPMWLSIST